MIEEVEIEIEIEGLGIIMYSPRHAAHIQEGSDYLQTRFLDPADVARHVREGLITTFGTMSPGTYVISTYEGYPDEEARREFPVRLRLGLRVVDRTICLRDLYDLLQWTGACPEEQQLTADDGVYEITVCTRLPESGIVGDQQEIRLYFQQVAEMPALQWQGVPTLDVDANEPPAGCGDG